MILIIGGVYQGRREYALNKFCQGKEKIYSIPRYREELNFEEMRKAQIWYNLENLVELGLDEDLEAYNILEDIIYKESMDMENKVLIGLDVSQGVVPMDKRQRAYREMNGRLLLRLADEAKVVVRVFCGCGQVLKGE